MEAVEKIITEMESLEFEKILEVCLAKIKKKTVKFYLIKLDTDL